MVVFGQDAGAAGELDADEGVVGIAVQPVGAALVERFQVSGATQIGEQQEALLQVLRQHGGHVHAGIAEQAGHGDERLAVLVRWRGIHGDERALARRDAEIAAEAGVGGGRCDAGRGFGELRPQPVVK